MSFDTRTGTRGRRQPGSGGPIGRWVTKRVMNRIRRKGKVPGLGFNALVLTTVGRKSGVQRQTPVGWFPGQDDSWLIVTSASGAPAGIEPATPSLPWNHREPLCEPLFPQVTPDRNGGSYRFSFGEVMRSLRGREDDPWLARP